MSHLPKLIVDLALILGAAGIITLLFRRLKQPVVLGYIIAGLVVGPNFHLFPSISDLEGVKDWAEIGVVFLLFALGLEFSFKKLASVGSSAAITGIFQLSFMMVAGYFTGLMLGWPQMDCIFLGGIIAISSTTIIFRAFEELGLKTRQFTSLVMGALIIEDLGAVILMVMLSTLAVSREAAGMEMLLALLKLVFFLSLWFILGIYLLPTFLKKVTKWLNNETLMVLAIALCLGMVVLADSVGFSAALGAFIMGSILSETIYGEKIEHLITSIKDLFGAVFFVSVGMLIDPRFFKEYIWIILLITLIVVVGKTFSTALGALIAGRPLKQAVSAGTSMAQIGEFSFIIASLGISLKVTSNYLYPVAVGVSVITTFVTPYMIKMADPLYNLLEKILPNKWLASLNKYSMGSQTIKGESDWRIVFNAYMRTIFINSVIIVALILLSDFYLRPFVARYLENNVWAKILSLTLTLAAMAPFVWALMARKINGIAYKALWLDSKYNHGPLVTLEVARNGTAILLVGFLFRQFFPFWYALIGTAIVMIIVLVLFQRRLQLFYNRIENRFITNLKGKEIVKKEEHELSPWDAHLSKFTMGPNSSLVGASLGKLLLREKYGINIAFIERGNRTIYAPSKFDRLFPHDEIGVIGTDEQLQVFSKIVESANEDLIKTTSDGENIRLEKIVVDETNGLTGKTIRESGIREKTNGLVVGIERNGKRTLNPASDVRFEWEDVIWLVGDKQKIREYYRVQAK